MFHRSACSATTRSNGAERPPTRVGGCGRWTGLGFPNAPVSRTWVLVKSERLGLGPQPSEYRERLGEALHGVREVVERPAVRFVLPPGQGVTGREPAPMPKSSRPPETMSTVVAILASIAGGRKRLLVTSSPTRSRWVWAGGAER